MRNIGRAKAMIFARERAKVVAADIDAEGGETVLLRHEPRSEVALCLLSTRRRLGWTAFVLELFVDVRLPSGREVQEGPHRLHRAHMSWILPGSGGKKNSSEAQLSLMTPSAPCGIR